VNLILLGPIGSGKGTLNAHLASRYNLAVLEMGKALARYAEINDEYRVIHESGRQAPTPLVMDILARTIAEVPRDEDGRTLNGWLLDGVVRNPDQTLEFLKLRHAGRLPRFDALVILEAPRDILERRILNRRTCDRCGAIYNLETAPPPSPEQCTAVCGGSLVARGMDQDPVARATRFDIDATLATPAREMLAAESGLPVIRLDATADSTTVAHEADRKLLGQLSMRRTGQDASTARRPMRRR
jgi:adenylate kinase